MTSKVVIVTGASRGTRRSRCKLKALTLSGIGLAAAQKLLKSPKPTNLVVLARSVEPLKDLKSQYPGQVEYVAGNITDPKIARQSVDLAVKTWGRLDGLILNHGRLEPIARVDQSTGAEWRENFNVNFFSCVDFVSLPPLTHRGLRVISNPV